MEFITDRQILCDELKAIMPLLDTNDKYGICIRIKTTYKTILLYASGNIKEIRNLEKANLMLQEAKQILDLKVV
jgi:hypothetical protein